MRFVLGAVALLLLSGCATDGTTPAAFLSNFEPSPHRIAKYEDANRRDYTPRVRAQGVEAVNAAVNANPYKRDVADEWDPTALWVKGGDCEDYALAKMRELEAQGITDSYVLVLTARGGTESHAVLVVNDQGQMLALDNERKAPVPAARLFANWKARYLIEGRTGRVLVPTGHTI